MADQNGSVQLEGASSLKDFCERNSICRASAYIEISAGRLVAHKCRGKTLILKESEVAWRVSLPKLQTQTAA